MRPGRGFMWGRNRRKKTEEMGIAPGDFVTVSKGISRPLPGKLRAKWTQL